MPMTLAMGINWGQVGTTALVVAFLFICLLLMLTVLIQRPQGGGLSGAFGSGAGSGQTAFGARTGDALTVTTIIMFVLYLGAAVALNFAARPSVVEATPAAVSGAGAPAGERAPAAGAAPETPPAEPGTPPERATPTAGEGAATGVDPVAPSPVPSDPAGEPLEPAGDPPPDGR